MENKLIKIVAEKFNKDPKDILPNTRFVEDLLADSVDLVELIMIMEEEFGIEFDDSKLNSILTVGDAEEYLSDALK